MSATLVSEATRTSLVECRRINTATVQPPTMPKYVYPSTSPMFKLCDIAIMSQIADMTPNAHNAVASPLKMSPVTLAQLSSRDVTAKVSPNSKLGKQSGPHQRFGKTSNMWMRLYLMHIGLPKPIPTPIDCSNVRLRIMSTAENCRPVCQHAQDPHISIRPTPHGRVKIHKQHSLARFALRWTGLFRPTSHWPSNFTRM